MRIAANTVAGCRPRRSVLALDTDSYLTGRDALVEQTRRVYWAWLGSMYAEIHRLRIPIDHESELMSLRKIVRYCFARERQ